MPEAISSFFSALVHYILLEILDEEFETVAMPLSCQFLQGELTELFSSLCSSSQNAEQSVNKVMSLKGSG